MNGKIHELSCNVYKTRMEISSYLLNGLHGFHIITNTISCDSNEAQQHKSKLWLKIQVIFCTGCMGGGIMPIEFQISTLRVQVAEWMDEE